MSAKCFFGNTICILGVLAITGCADMSRQEQRIVSGAAAGTAIGAAGTVLTGGCVACGAAIGGAVGAGTGYVVDKMEKRR